MDKEMKLAGKFAGAFMAAALLFYALLFVGACLVVKVIFF